MVDSVTKQFDSLDDTKKDKWVKWLEQKGFGNVVDFNDLPDAVLSLMDRNLTK